MIKMPVAPYPSEFILVEKSQSLANRFVDHMLQSVQASDHLNMKPLRIKLEEEIHNMFIRDHFLPYYERVNFFEHLGLDFFQAHPTSVISALQTGVCENFCEDMSVEYKKYANERKSYWVVHTAIGQKYTKSDLQKVAPPNTSGLSNFNWQILMEHALVDDQVGAVEFITETASDLNLRYAFVSALHSKAHCSLQYILPRLDTTELDLSEWLVLCSNVENEEAFRYFCGQFPFGQWNKVVQQFCEEEDQWGMELFERITAERQNQRLANEVSKKGALGINRKL